MEMWRPKEGFERRFEIRRREECEREEERKRRGEEEENTAGLVTRRLRPIRSRMASGGGVEDSGRGRDEKGAELRRSISDMHLSVRRRHGTQSEERKHVKSMLLDEGEGLADTPSDLLTAGSKEVGGEEARDGEGRGGGAGGEGERGSGCSDLEKLSQSLILPPTDQPYFLLLQGYTQKKDFVLYVMAGHTHIFGRTLTPAERERERGSEREREGKRRDKLRVDTFLSAPDILPRHLLVRRDSALRGHAPSAETGHAPSAALVRPFRGGVVTHNGAELVREAKLRPGDVLGLGQHFLFLYKDPRCVSAPLLPALLSPLRSPTRSPPSLVGALCCQACGRSQAERQARLREYLSSTQPVLRYSIAHEEQLLREIVEKNGSPDSGAGALAPAFLLSLCIDHASKHLHPAHLPALLLKTANLVKGLVWDKIKEIGDKQPENQEKSDVSALSIEALTSELRPLMFWMSNATELLNYIQVKVEDMERDLEFESSSDLSADLETSSEALALLDDVIMYTFQQCVYYLTKTLYSALPALLDSNPFSLPPPSALPPDPSPLTPDLSLMPGGVARVLEVYLSTLELTRTCQLHPDLVSQTFGYLLFFSNASLFNTLMERGSGSDSFFTWSRAVQIRTNLDLVLDWLQGAGLGDIANEFFRKLSITVNFLCIPKTRLIHSSWSSLQEEYPLLSPAQLNHLLRHYRLGAGREPPTSWQPPEDSNLSSDIFESFLDHPPLILPNEVSRLGLGEPITSQELQQEVQRIRAFLLDLEQEALPANQRIQLLLGLCNNFAYVIMLSAAHDILSQQQAGTNATLPTDQPTVLNGTDWELPSIAVDNSSSTSRYDCNPVSTAAILLADILPTLVIKFSAPFFIHLIPYSIRVLLCSLTAAASFIIVSFSTGIWMSILGVVFASVSSGLGELSFLGLTSFFHSSVISGWSSGTGGAGILGALSYSGLTQVGLSPKNTLLVMLLVPVLMMISYFGVLVHPPSLPGWSRKRAPPQTDRGARRPLLDEEDHQEDVTNTETLGLKEKVFIVRGLLKYMIPLAVVYFAEYFINQGLFELLYFPKSDLKHSEQYRWYQTLYQLGVFISRSSVNCVQIKKIWILAALQCVNALVLLLAVYYQFFPSIFIVFAFILYEGLLGGASYVNTFNNISRESSDSLREFSLGAACVSDTLGISLSGALAIPLHDYLCRLP